MADAAVGFLLENLKQVLVYKVELIKDVKDEVEGLHQHLILFKAFLKDSTEKRNSNQVLKALANQIRDVADKAEDAIDRFIVYSAIHQSKGVVKKLFGYVGHSNKKTDIAEEIKKIRAEVDDIYKKKQFGFESPNLEDSAAMERKPPVIEDLDNVVGFVDEAKTVIGRLIEGPKELEVISIIGMAGLGKTTLANKIYNDPAIEYEFFTRAWVFVSEKYSTKDVFLSILSQLQPTDDLYKQPVKMVAEALRATLNKGKYLIVMDDVWTPEAWDELKVAFPSNNRGSRVLITSRHRNVALHANCNSDPYDLKIRSPGESWELLRKKVFGKGECPAELQALGVKIAAECKGLPLAIVVIAGILLNQRDIPDWWIQVAQDVSSYIFTDPKKFMDVVGWSYNNLPYRLKSCFLYFGVFPEYFEIPVWKLIRLWVAEGFIEESGESSFEDIAEASLEDLVNRNLVMVAKRRSNGRMKTCRVHDLLFDFCKSKAREENFYHEIKGSAEGSINKHRRLCIHSDVVSYISSGPSGEHVRSFLCFAPDEIHLDSAYISTIPKAFKLLRVLDLRPIIFTRFPKELLQLVLLRYIALASNFKALPTAISNLWNIQTMIIETSSRTLEIKKEMWGMHQLRHLHTNASASLPRPPPDTGKAKGRENVQTLSSIAPESCIDQVFAKVPNIKKLGVRGKLATLVEGESSLFNNFATSQNLTNLKLFNDVIPRSALPRLPPAYMFPPKLRKLTLSDTSLDWEQMYILGSLENLEVLKLKENAFKGAWWKPREGGFRVLKLLHIGRTDLKYWSVEAKHFPSLKRLVLQHCDKLQDIPASLADVRSFQVLELFRTSSEAAYSAKTIQKLKLQKEAQGGFKLSIYPPDLIAN